MQHCCSEYTCHWPFLNPNEVQVSLHNAFTCTSPKTNMDTQNGGLEKVDSSRIWPFLVYMLDFWGVYSRDTYDINTPKRTPKVSSSTIFVAENSWVNCSFQGRWRVKSPQQCGVRRRPWKMWGVWGQIDSGLVVQQTYNHPPPPKKTWTTYSELHFVESLIWYCILLKGPAWIMIKLESFWIWAEQMWTNASWNYDV